MIDFLIRNYTFIIGLNMLFYILYSIIRVVLSSSSKSSKADQEPEDKFEVREEWKDFLKGEGK